MLKRYRIYLLVGVAVLMAWINIRSPAVTDVVNVIERSASLAPMARPPFSQPNAAVTAVLTQFSRPPIESAARDPFEAMALPPSPMANKTASPLLPLPVATPAPPAPPPLNLNFAGRMTAPDGREMIYVAFANTSFPVSVGQTLPNGYRVEAITARAVELSYPPLNTTTRLDLPAPPKYEIR